MRGHWSLCGHSKRIGYGLEEKYAFTLSGDRRRHSKMSIEAEVLKRSSLTKKGLERKIVCSGRYFKAKPFAAPLTAVQLLLPEKLLKNPGLNLMRCLPMFEEFDFK